MARLPVGQPAFQPTRQLTGGGGGGLPAQDENGPVPLAYFPLTASDLDSLTLPAYTGLVGSIENTTLDWVDDDKFGSAPLCKKVSAPGSAACSACHGCRCTACLICQHGTHGSHTFFPLPPLQTDKNALLLDNVPYARNGSFAVSLWMRRVPGSNLSGDVFQYLFSHTNAGQGGAAAANQVRCCNERGGA